ncbi:VTT domain-containing protein [Actinoalloteichus hymeniacidonis]|nr:VTT domain-containing protein [Actinoalloteichus hymeniacidonis]MBB5909292.1 membrane protein YqaA with SNARE-associated domain [Actinoalloteichus hymeniacidonis]
MSAAFGVSVLSAVLPLISIELFIVALMLNKPETSWWQLALVVASGQILGKLLYYFVGRGTVGLPKFLHREKKPSGRWARRLDGFRSACHDRPVWTTGVLLTSSFVSLPPFVAVSVVAGVARVPLRLFIATGLAGRFVRFSLVASVPGVLGAWWF